MAGAHTATAARMELGPCHGEVGTQTFSKVGNCDLSAAVVLTPSQLKHYRGASITGARLYLATTDNLTALTAWTRDSIQGENTAAGTAAPQQGWQIVSFDSPIEVGDHAVAVGFTVSQTKSSKCIALGGDKTESGYYYAKNDKWDKIPDPQGSVCVELIVEGDMVPESDLSVESLRLEQIAVAQGEPMRLKAKVRNASLSEIAGFSYGCNFDNENYGSFTGEWTGAVAPKQAVEISMEVPTGTVLPDEVWPVTFNVNDEGIIDNNALSSPFGVYTFSYPRKLLLEEFTSEYCSNCPRAINTIAQAVADGYGDKMVVVAHHVGYQKDWLTLEEEKALVWFYGDDGSFAPAVMLDRTAAAPEAAVPVESIGYYETFGPRLASAVDKPGMARLGLNAWQNGNTIDIELSFKAHPLLKALVPEPRITVMLIEDGIKHRVQAGISNPDFTHSHVSRAYLTDVMGEPLEAEGTEAVVIRKSIEVNPDWNTADMQAVAFVHAYNPSDRTACGVQNAISTAIDTSGVEEIAVASGETEYFTLQGVRLSNPGPGIYLLRQGGETRKVMIR